MSEKREQQRREECRFIVREYLHDRPSVAQDADTITRMLRAKGHKYETEEVEGACSFLTTDGHLFEHRNKLGAIRHYQITAAGSRAHEETQV